MARPPRPFARATDEVIPDGDSLGARLVRAALYTGQALVTEETIGAMREGLPKVIKHAGAIAEYVGDEVRKKKTIPAPGPEPAPPVAIAAELASEPEIAIDRDPDEPREPKSLW